eukprot:CAMPEP_0170467464 /NCGR_PEP_ID=MMETSP0123-20130129/11033_1 /TAXON_ID=182087 /ORGANISM="Favella ehrenbergii, Strain Fehren 1" /LENGTH=36 /DNA_ID= /DNA_START= /DNA_END= /DNA_ORIENTATION=
MAVHNMQKLAGEGMKNYKKGNEHFEEHCEQADAKLE